MPSESQGLYGLYVAVVEVFSQLVVLIATSIDWLFTEHLLLSNIISAALLLGLADLTIQTLEIYILKSRNNYVGERFYHSMKVGIILGVFNHMWYAFLEDYLTGNGLSMVFKKIALDQLIAGPFFSSAFLVCMGLFEGRSIDSVYSEWREKFIHIYMVDWMFWPLAQFINFHLVPYRFRVFYVNFATYLWNTFLVYAKHVSEGVVKDRMASIVSKSSQDSLKGSPTEEKKVAPVCRVRSSSMSMSDNKQMAVVKRASRSASTRSRFKQRQLPGTPDRKLTKVSQEDPASSTTTNKPQTLTYAKQILPYLNRASLSYLHDDVDSLDGECFDPSWVSARTDVSNGCDSDIVTRGDSIPTVSQSSLDIKAHAELDGKFAESPVKMTNVKRAGVFGLSSKPKKMKQICPKPFPATDKHRPKQRTTLSLRGKEEKHIRSVPAICDKPSNKVKSSIPLSDKKILSPRKMKPLNNAGSFPEEPTCDTIKVLETIGKSVLELKHEVLLGQQELRTVLMENRAQMATLHELCSVTFMTVDNGTRNLNSKADQLASWVALDKKLNVCDVKAALEEILEKSQQEC